MWLEHLLFGARFDTSFSVSMRSSKSWQYEFSLFYILRRPQPESGRSLRKKASSLTILRKDNEVKLKEEIKLVCNEKKDRESIV